MKNKLSKLTTLHKSESLRKSRFSRANLVIFAIIFASIGGYLIYSSFAAGNTCTTTLSVGANVQNAVSGASGGSVVCLNAGNWPRINLAGIAPSGVVTLQPAPGANVHIAGLTLNGPGDTKNLTVQGFYFTDTVNGLCGIAGNVVFQYNTIQNINKGNAFYFYANGCGGSHVQTGISMLNNQMDHVGDCLTVAGGANIEKNFTFKNNVCGPGIGYQAALGSDYSHYVEIGCMSGGVFDNNLFMGPYDAASLSNTNAATAVHNNVFHCFGGGDNLSFSNNIIWHAQSRAQTVLIQSGSFDNLALNNNLFVNDPNCKNSGNNCPAMDIEIYSPHGLSVKNNTISQSSWGNFFMPGSACAAGEGCYANGMNMTLQNNIVEASPVSGYSNYNTWDCASGCTTDHNVSFDSSAIGTSAVKNWTPSYANTTWTPHDGEPYSPPPTGYYVASGLSFSGGWDGTGGPQGGVGAVAFDSGAAQPSCLASSNCFPKRPGSGAGSTGIPTGTTLSNCGSSATISTNNAVIDSCSYTGSLTVSGSNVTIRKTRIMGSIQTSGSGSFTIEDSELGPNSGCGSEVALIRWSNYTARRNYLHNNGDGMRFAGDNIIAEDNFIETCDLPGDHSDGIQADHSGFNNIVNHNTIDLRGSVNGPNAPVFFADLSKSGTITNNLLITRSNGDFALKVHDDNTPDIGPWVVTGNRLLGIPLTTNTECNASTMTWSNNRQVTIDSSYNILTTGDFVNCDGSTSPGGSSDSTPPTVSVTAPSAGASISGSSVTLSAIASDNVGVVGVQFKVDGNNVGSEDTSSPYSITWNSATVTNGSHTVTAVARDAAGNSTTSSSISITTNNTTSCSTSSSTWDNHSITSQASSFTFDYDATPSANNIDSVVGLSSGSATDYTSLATITRFNDTGTIDARNGGAYTAVNNVPYSAGTTYHFKLTVNVANHTYSATVTPSGGSATTIATNYAFRTEQAGVSSLNNWATNSVSGSITICSATLNQTTGPKTGDINNDNNVNITDLSLLLSSYNQNTTNCITNNSYTCDLSSPPDNVVNIFDLSILLSHYGT